MCQCFFSKNKNKKRLKKKLNEKIKKESGTDVFL